MRLKTKLVLAITGLVFLVVTVLSWLFLEQLLAQRISQSYAANDMVAQPDSLLHAARVTNGLQRQTVRSQRSHSPARCRRWTRCSTTRDSTGSSAAVNRYSPTVYDVAIADRDNRALLSTDPTQDNVQLPEARKL